MHNQLLNAGAGEIMFILILQEFSLPIHLRPKNMPGSEGKAPTYDSYFICVTKQQVKIEKIHCVKIKQMNSSQHDMLIPVCKRFL